MKNKIEALAIDVDGTITDSSRRVCISALKAIRKVEKSGIPVIIATGNIVDYAYATATLVGTTGGLVCENGGVIYKDGLNNDKVIVLGDKNNVNSAYAHLQDELGENLPIKVVDDAKSRLSEIAFYKNMDSTPIKECLKDYDVRIYDSGFAIHITDATVNKGSSLKKLATLTGLNIENIMAIGDSENDLEFLSHAGLSVAVANASDDLKDLADYICENKYGDGVSEAVDKFIFNK